MEELCDNILASLETDPLETALRLMYAILAILSMLGLCVVAVSIFYNKQLGEHPSPLIARICVVEAIMSWNSLLSFIKPKFIVCYFDAYIAFGPMTGQTYYEAFVMLIIANDLINNTVQLISLFLNLFLCIDLVLTLWSPFNVTHNRLANYTMASVTAAVGLVVYIYYQQDRPQIDRLP